MAGLLADTPPRQEQMCQTVALRHMPATTYKTVTTISDRVRTAIANSFPVRGG
jgi:hypothetical protein